MTKNSCFLLFSLCAMAVLGAEESFEEICMIHTQEPLLEAAQKYINFVNRIGEGDTSVQMDEAVLLFVPNCKKVFNGHLLMENRENIVNDLLSVYKNYGGWKHIPLDIISASTNDAVVLRTIIETEGIGTNTAILILRFDSSNLIKEINEVFSPVKDHCDFTVK